MYFAYDVGNVAAIEKGKLLIVKKRDFWILPGGEKKQGEDLGECILRELGEELPQSRLVDGLVYFDRFYGKSPSGSVIKVVCCFGKIEGDITPANEDSILDAKWVSREELFSIYKDSLSEITQRIVVKLWQMKLI